ncbi:MAG TPA: 2-amino-4-hydroxy-6-hydroxymethyldihydropteridine diphosphokinase [Methylophilaceae bacterium]|jgi:2-amino-4-hydroxy-6-hydroxymethyldihydropteridine diphosphokinase
MNQAFIALGSNLQQPQRQVSRALHEIAELPQTSLVRQSSLYRTAPVGYDNQPDFINAVAEVETGLKPLELLQAILGIEDQHGRERPFPNAPRVLDLDLLLYNNMTMDTAELTLPHPRMHERAFVLLPLAEIAPDLMLPEHGHVKQLAQQCLDQGVEKMTA